MPRETVEIPRDGGEYKPFNLWRVLVCFIVLNVVVTSMICRFIHDDLTETQIFKRIPQSFIYNFK